MKRYTISYNDKEYMLVELPIYQGTADKTTVTVSSTDLEEELLKDMEQDVQMAIKLDETICYYVTPEEIKLPYDKIAKIVEEHYN